MTTVALVLDPIRAPELAATQARYHAAAGVTHVVVTDTNADVVTRALDGLATTIVAVTIEPAAVVAERLDAAASRCGADWILEAEPGVFWWPRGADLGETLGAVVHRYDVVHALDRPLLATGGSAPLFERATLREPSMAPPAPGAVCRAAHRARGNAGRSMRGWRPLETFLLPGPLDEAQRSPPEIEEALARGTLVRDTRLRDALDVLGGGMPAGTLLRADGLLRFPRPSIADEAAYALEMALVEPYGIVEAQARLDAVEERLHALERTPWHRLARRATRLRRPH